MTRWLLVRIQLLMLCTEPAIEELPNLLFCHDWFNALFLHNQIITWLNFVYCYNWMCVNWDVFLFQHMVSPQLASAYPQYPPATEQPQQQSTEAKDNPLFPPSLITANGIEQQTVSCNERSSFINFSYWTVVCIIRASWNHS